MEAVHEKALQMPPCVLKVLTELEETTDTEFSDQGSAEFPVHVDSP